MIAILLADRENCCVSFFYLF